MGFRKGTGFTNINRILQANKGSKLGSAVSGGIGQQVQKVQSGVAGAKQEFEKKAEENRLDTDAAKQQREQTLGRFDATPINVDESKFAISSGLQSEYDTKKKDTSGFLEKEKTSLAGLKDTSQFNRQYEKQLADYTAAYNAMLRPHRAEADPIWLKQKQFATQRDQNIAAYNAANFGKVQQAEGNISSFGKQLSDVETDYTTRSAAEKAAYMDAEQRKIQQSLLPSEAELGQFSKFSKGAYGGPAQLENADALVAQAQQAESLGKLARTPGGSQELLKQFVGGRDYTSGQRKLDETLLGQDKGTNLGAATRQTRGLSKSVEEASRGAAAKGQEYSNRARAFGEETRGMIEAKQTPLISQLEERMAGIKTADTARTTQFDRIQGILGGKEFAGVDPVTRTNIALDQAVKNKLISPEEMTELSAPGGLIEQARKLGIDPNQLLAVKLQDKQAQNLTRSGLATGSENVRLAALNRLLGKQDYENEFASGDRYQAATTGLDMAGLREHLRLSTPQAQAPALPPASQYTPGAVYHQGKGWTYSDENLKENIEYSDKDVKAFLDRIKPAAYDYKDKVKNSPLASPDRQLGVMAQDLEKSKLGKEAVSEGEDGKIVDYKDLQPKMLASLAALNQRLKKIEGK